jgi:sulfatase maturation enzyme AslB (radical SAM superfamily)
VYEPVWGDTKSKRDYLSQFSEQLDLLVQHYVENPDLEVPTLLSLPLRLFLRAQEPDHSWCGSGKTMRAYDTDGRMLPCHRFSRFCTNKIYQGQQSIGPKLATKCDNCILAAACPNCPGYNWQVNGDPGSRTSYHCEFIKLQFLAAAKLEFLRNQRLVHMLINGGLKDSENVPIKVLENLQGADFVMRTLDADSIISSVV